MRTYSVMRADGGLDGSMELWFVCCCPCLVLLRGWRFIRVGYVAPRTHRLPVVVAVPLKKITLKRENSRH